MDHLEYSLFAPAVPSGSQQFLGREAGSSQRPSPTVEGVDRRRRKSPIVQADVVAFHGKPGLAPLAQLPDDLVFVERAGLLGQTDMFKVDSGFPQCVSPGSEVRPCRLVESSVSADVVLGRHVAASTFLIAAIRVSAVIERGGTEQQCG